MASLVRLRYGLPGCSPPVRIRLEHPAFEDFYFQASNGSVALPVAGYNYNSDWTPLLAGLWAELPGIFATRTDVLSPCMLRILEDLSTDWHRLDARIADLSSEIEALARQDKGCARLMTVPGIGPVISSAIGGRARRRRCVLERPRLRRMARAMPKQLSTGDRTILGSISKRGNRYLRSLFVQAAWVVLVKIGPKHWDRYGLKSWIEAARKRLHHNVLAIALANKLARIAWAVLRKGRIFECVKTNEAASRPA